MGSRWRANIFVKPNEQNRACSSYAMARKRRMKSNAMYIQPLNKWTRSIETYDGRAQMLLISASLHGYLSKDTIFCAKYVPFRLILPESDNV